MRILKKINFFLRGVDPEWAIIGVLYSTLKMYLLYNSLRGILNGEGHSSPTRIRQSTMAAHEGRQTGQQQEAAAGKARGGRTLQTTLR